MGRYRKAPRTLIVPDRTLLSVLSSPSAKEVHHVLHIVHRNPLSEMPGAVKVRAIELHLARRELAIQYFRCADCGDVEAKFISLKPLKLPELAA
jgi:hypothetical protein